MKQLRPFWNKQKQKEAFTGHDKKNTEFYTSSLWRSIRGIVLRRDKGICQACLRPVEICGMPPVVDHIKPINQGGSATDYDNLQLLGTPCHNSKSGKESKQNQNK